MNHSNQKIFAFRLLPGEDLKIALLNLARRHQWKAAYILTCVGSLQEYKIRLAGAYDYANSKQKMEIVSLVGTLFDGGCHLHIGLSDSKGAMIGGHVEEGCIINTTAEIVVGEATELAFSRVNDMTTTYLELHVGQR